MSKRKVIIASMIMFQMMSTVSLAAEIASIKLQVGSKQAVINSSSIIALDAAPYVNNNVTMVPLRFISEHLKAKVGWDQQKKEITITKESDSIILIVDSKKAIVNGNTTTLDCPATIVNNTTFIPLRFASENLNAKITWVSSSKSILIEPKTSINNSSVEEDEAAIRSVMELYIQYQNEKNAAGFISTWHNSPDSVEKLQMIFDSQGSVMEQSIEEISNIKINNNTASINMTRVIDTYFSNLLHRRRDYMEIKLMKIDNQWKINSVTMVKIEPFQVVE